MANKNAQLTIFLIVGILVLITTLSVFYILSLNKSSELQQFSEQPVEIVSLEKYIEACIEDVGQNAISYISSQGGYFDLPEYSLNHFEINTAYYYHLNRNLMPSLQKIEEELAKYVNSHLLSCLGDFADFKDFGLDIEQGKLSTKAAVTENKVVFYVTLPITTRKEESSATISMFSGVVDNVRLKTVYDVTENITFEQLKNPSSVCLSCLVNLGIKNDIQIDIHSAGNSSVIFTITDNASVINSSSLKYVFANKYTDYSCSNPSPDADSSYLADCINKQITNAGYEFTLEEIQDMKAYVNSTFGYTVNATGLGLIFDDNTPLFDIDEKSGVIDFIPTIEHQGVHAVWIHVKDQLGNERYGSFLLDISLENE